MIKSRDPHLAGGEKKMLLEMGWGRQAMADGVKSNDVRELLRVRSFGQDLRLPR